MFPVYHVSNCFTFKIFFYSRVIHVRFFWIIWKNRFISTICSQITRVPHDHTTEIRQCWSLHTARTTHV